VPKEGADLKKNRASPDNTLARVIEEPYSPPPLPVCAYFLGSALQYTRSNSSRVPFLPASHIHSPLPSSPLKQSPHLRSSVFSEAVAQECLGAVSIKHRYLHLQSQPQPPKPLSRGTSQAKQKALACSTPQTPISTRPASAASSPAPHNRASRKRSPPTGVSPSLVSRGFS